MRTGMVAVGIVLLVLGAVLAFVPLLQAGSQDVSESTPWGFNVTAAFSITGTVPLTISYSSSQSVNILVGTCDSISYSSGSPQCTNPTVSGQNGSSGTFNINVKPGGAVVVGILGAGTASVTVKEAQTPLGDILLILGIVVLLVGLVMRRRPSPAPMAAPTAPPSS